MILNVSSSWIHSAGNVTVSDAGQVFNVVPDVWIKRIYFNFNTVIPGSFFVDTFDCEFQVIPGSGFPSGFWTSTVPLGTFNLSIYATGANKCGFLDFPDGVNFPQGNCTFGFTSYSIGFLPGIDYNMSAVAYIEYSKSPIGKLL